MADIDEKLIAAGFRPFCGSWTIAAIGSFEKCIRDDKGKKYYILVYKYHHDDIGFSYEANIQFNTSTGIIFNTQILHANNHEVATIESFFESLWKMMGCKYYEPNDD